MRWKGSAETGGGPSLLTAAAVNVGDSFTQRRAHPLGTERSNLNSRLCDPFCPVSGGAHAFTLCRDQSQAWHKVLHGLFIK